MVKASYRCQCRRTFSTKSSYQGSSIGDSQKFAELLKQINSEQKIEAVYSDGAYDTKDCYQSIHQRRDCAIVPPSKNAQPLTGEHPRTQALKASHHFGKES